MSLLISLLGSTGGGGGGGGGSVGGVILAPVIAATTTALTATYANGTAGVGATLTNNTTQAAFALDGISLSLGQRVLIKNQSSAFQNGIYTVTVVGTGATNWVLTRATDFDQAAEMTAGTQVDVASGTVNAATAWVLTANVATVGTNSVSFSGVGATIAAATQAQQETGSSTAVYTSPGTQQYHPSAAKFWVVYTTISTTTINASYNVTSLTDNGTGDTTINYTVAFSTINYAVNASCQASGGAVTVPEVFTDASNNAVAPLVGACRIATLKVGVAAGDTIVCVSGYGDQ